MSTVILKWNPAISSYTMKDFVNDMSEVDDDYCSFNWSVWDHDMVKEGDEFFWLKVGYGQNGIVGHGKITSDPYEGEDWSGKGRRTYYVDFTPDLMICPDAFPLLDSDTLKAAIPDFDWHGGHSGQVLTDVQATWLHALWKEYTAQHSESFELAKSCNAAMKRSIHKSIYNDGSVEVSVEIEEGDSALTLKENFLQTTVTIWDTTSFMKAYGCPTLKKLYKEFKRRYSNPHAIGALTQDLLSLHIPFYTSYYNLDDD